MSADDEVQELRCLGETLKESIYQFMEKYKLQHDGLISSMNETIDLLYELDATGE